jgi:hypothetical protein
VSNRSSATHPRTPFGTVEADDPLGNNSTTNFSHQASFHRIRASRELLGVVFLGTNASGQWTAEAFSRSQAIEHEIEIILWLPAEFPSDTFVDIDAVDARNHAPTAACILCRITGIAAAHRDRGIGAQIRQIAWRGCMFRRPTDEPELPVIKTFILAPSFDASRSGVRPIRDMTRTGEAGFHNCQLHCCPHRCGLP